MNYSSLAAATSRLFTRRYLIALACVAVLSALGQVVVQVALSRQQHDAEVINRAGRQRNFSQALVKCLLATRHLDPAGVARMVDEAQSVLDRLDRVHRGLQLGDAELGLPANRSMAVTARFAELEPVYDEFSAVIRSGIAARTVDDATIVRLIETQGRFLELMEAVVNQLDQEASARVLATRILEGSLFAVLTIVLVIEALFIFRPTVRRIALEIAERERAERLAIEREIAEASGRLERRIGQDLHDGLGQVLTGISFQAKALQRRLADGAHPDAGAVAAADIAGQVGQAIATTRSLARLLNPVETDAHGLGAAMHDLATTAEKVFLVACACEWDSDLPIPALSGDGHETPPAMHLYRIAQEAVSNAIRHGGAKHLIIRGETYADGGHLVVEDDGDGFDPQLTQGSARIGRTGMGLRIMAFRAERIGATWTLSRKPDRGMRVEVRWTTRASPPG